MALKSHRLFISFSAAIATLALLILSARCKGLLNHAVPLPASIEAPADGISLPMDDFGGRPVVSIEINGRGPFRFILDTGATVAVFEPALKDELSLPAAAGMHADAAPGGSAPTIVSLSEVRLGALVLRGVIAAVMPYSPVRGEGAPRGVLSAFSFPGYLLKLDYPGKRISIRKGELGAADCRKIFAYPADDPLPTVQIRVAGRETRVHLDSGSGYGLTLPTKFLAELPLGSEPKDAGTAKTFGGEFPIKRAIVKGPIELGAYRLELPEVLFSDVRPGGDAPVGNIGATVLRDFVVTLDSKNRRIRFERSLEVSPK